MNYHIHYTDFGHKETVSCLRISSNAMFYFRKNFKHHYVEIVGNKYVISSNVRIMKEQAKWLSEAHFNGKFEKVDLGDLT